MERMAVGDRQDVRIVPVTVRASPAAGGEFDHSRQRISDDFGPGRR